MSSTQSTPQNPAAYKAMKAVVASVQPGSIADELGLQASDIILAVNGRRDLEDLLDYQFELADAQAVELWVEHPDGTEEIFDIEKDSDEDLGLVFTSPLFTPIKTCNNACPFCFIDQQPEGLRPSLYVKDDDYRLSYFNQTYITLSNLTPHDRERITQLRPGPLYVSVHATQPEVRQVLLKNPKAGNILQELRWLKSLDIPFHCQIVVCPGLNDGDVLSQSLQDLAELRPQALSVAVVPVGLTQYRQALPDLTPVDAQTANQVLDRVHAFRQQSSAAENFAYLENFVYLSDEFYAKAGRPLPEYQAYGDFPQLDDGVGTARMLLEDFYALTPMLPQKITRPTCTKSVRWLLLTGKLAAITLSPIVNRLNQIEGLYIDLLSVENHFWGQAVDVAGLITGQDIIQTLKQQAVQVSAQALGQSDENTLAYDGLILPGVMLKPDIETPDNSDKALFLDSLSVAEVSAQIGLPITVVWQAYSARALLQTIGLLT